MNAINCHPAPGRRRPERRTADANYESARFYSSGTYSRIPIYFSRISITGFATKTHYASFQIEQYAPTNTATNINTQYHTNPDALLQLSHCPHPAFIVTRALLLCCFSTIRLRAISPNYYLSSRFCLHCVRCYLIVRTHRQIDRRVFYKYFT